MNSNNESKYSGKKVYKDPFDVVVVFVSERPNNWDGATALSDRLVPFDFKNIVSVSCILPIKRPMACP